MSHKTDLRYSELLKIASTSTGFLFFYSADFPKNAVINPLEKNSELLLYFIFGPLDANHHPQVCKGRECSSRTQGHSRHPESS